MDISSLGSLPNAARATEKISSDSVETNKSSSNEIQGQGSLEDRTSKIPPVQAPNVLSHEEGSIVTHDNFSSTNIKVSEMESESGSQLDVLA